MRQQHRKRTRVFAALAVISMTAAIVVAGGAAFTGGSDGGSDQPTIDQQQVQTSEGTFTRGDFERRRRDRDRERNRCFDGFDRNRGEVTPLLDVRGTGDTRDGRDERDRRDRWRRDCDRRFPIIVIVQLLPTPDTLPATTAAAPPVATPQLPTPNSNWIFFCLTNDGRNEAVNAGVYPRTCRHPSTDYHIAVQGVLLP